MKSNYAINIDDGRLVFRTVATDRLTALYRKIDNDVANAIIQGSIDPMDVVNAIMAEERFSGVFNWKDFERQKRILNMRTQDVELADSIEEMTEKLPDDKPGETISISRIEKLIEKSPKAKGKGKSKADVESLGLEDE